MKKIVVTDLDGTLLNSQHEISSENRQALQFVREKGAEVVIATGRTYANAKAICEKADISAHIISNNGSFVHAANGEKLHSITLDKQIIRQALEWLQNNEYYFEISSEANVFLCSATRAVLEVDFNKAKSLDPDLNDLTLENMWKLQQTQVGISLVNTVEDILNAEQEYCNILSISFDKDKLQRGRDYFRGQQEFSMVVSHYLNFELVNSHASKGNALSFLSEHLQVPLSSVIAIGDNYNDISMLERAGVSVAMGNADDEIKKRCSYVSQSCDQHGVAAAINQYRHFFE